MKMSGTIYKVAGPVVVAENMQPQMYDVVYVGDEELMGEVIQIEDDKCHIQVYEDTTGVKPGEPVTNTEHPLSVELGPGLLGSIYDGLQRPLVELQKLSGDFIERGEDAPGIDLEKEYDFSPRVEEGDKVRPGQVIGTTEVKNGKHRVMVPPNVEGGKVEKVKSGEQTVKETVVKLESGEEISMRQEWPIRQSRPVQEELKPEVPLVTGQRVLDGLFPLAKGGTAAIPGPFGSGKCVTGDTPVMLADGSKKPIKELYDSHKNKGDRTIEENEQWTNLDEPLNVLSKKDGELVEKEADVVYKGKTSSTIEINSKSGRNIELTPVHKLFVLTPEMEVIEKQAQNIESDDTLIIPRNLPIDAEDQELNVSNLLPEKRVVGTDFEKAQEAIELLENKFSSRKQVAKEIGAKPHKLDSCAQGKNRPKVKLATELIEKSGLEHRISKVKGERQAKTVDVPSKITEEFAELLGLLLGDGSLKPKSVHFYNNDEKLLKRVEDLIKSLFELETERETANTVESVKVNSKAFRDLLVELGFPEKKKSLNCSIPEKVLQSSDRVIAGFIRGYFLADGGFNKYNVEISTSSEKMQEDLSYSLTRLGTVPRLSEKETSASKHYRVRLSGSELKTFHEKTKTDHQKYRKIQAYLENTERHFRSNESVDISADTIHKAFKESDTKRIKLEKHGIELSNYTQLGENMSVPVLQDFADLTNNEELQAISGNHLEHFYPDPVTSVNFKEDLKDVYDLTVPETHNFVGGNAPMILHNTVTQQSLAKYSDADIIVYIGCGERGNEMTEVLEEFPELEDPQTGDKIINRTVLIANTSNMPVAAREASIYTGVTIAEYFRDQGLDVALMADSTSRWAEAMREVSARLEEMPGERGYPAYLSSRLAEFYERAGRVQPLGPEDTGSVSIVGAVSPPGGDFSEPVTQNTLRVVKNFWALDSDLAEKRHFPSINWDDSYSGYKDKLSDYFEEEVDEEWQSNIQRMRNILQKDGELQETVQLVGKDALPDRERLTLEVGSMIKRFYLQQNAFHPVDEYSPPEKTYHILDLVLDWADEAYSALEDGAVVENIISLKSKNRISELPTSEDYLEVKEDVKNQMNEEFKEVRN